MKKHIPNLITLGNLLCGTIATIAAVNGNFEIAALSVTIGILLDFFDGFFARILNVSGELGKQLDSLADMVTSGVVPGIVMFTLLQENSLNLFERTTETLNIASFSTGYFPYFGLVLTLAACYRLAKFNIDTRQSDSFIGVPTPANAMVIAALPLIQAYQPNYAGFISPWVILAYIAVMSYLLISELPLFALKFKSYAWAANSYIYSFLIASVALLLVFQFFAVPLIIVLYILMSLVRR